jgi:hypothetical protein
MRAPLGEGLRDDALKIETMRRVVELDRRLDLGLWMASRLASVVVLGALVVSACTAESEDATGPPKTSPKSIALALLLDGRLVRVSLPVGVVAAPVLLSRGAIPTTGHYLAHDANGRTLFALVNRAGGKRDVLVVVDVATGEVRARYELTGEAHFGSVAIGSRTGRIYLFGNRGRSAIVAIRAPDGRIELGRWTARGGRSGNWSVYRGVVSEDERLLYLSYHGPDTSGADVFRVDEQRRAECPIPPKPSLGCFHLVHGNMEPLGDELVAATGDFGFIRVGPDGTTSGRWDAGLEGNHLTDFTLDRAEGRVYAVGSCGYAGGFSVVDLASDRVRVLVPPASPPAPVCGERTALAPGSLLVVGKTERPSPIPGKRGALLLVDAKTGRLRGSISTPAEPIDVLVVPAR